MTKKSEIIVEQFPQGITLRWKDLDGEAMPTKSLAIEGAEFSVISKEIWEDISEILSDTMIDKVLIKLEYKPL